MKQCRVSGTYVSGEEALRHLVRTVLGAPPKIRRRLVAQGIAAGARRDHLRTATPPWVAARYSWPDWRASAK